MVPQVTEAVKVIRGLRVLQDHRVFKVIRGLQVPLDHKAMLDRKVHKDRQAIKVLQEQLAQLGLPALTELMVLLLSAVAVIKF
jgi:hypothetical protein